MLKLLVLLFDSSLLFGSERRLLLCLLLVNQVLQQVLWVDHCLPLVQVLDVLQSLHELHLPLRVVGLILEVFHRVFLLFIGTEPPHVLFCLLRVPNGLVVARASSLYDIVVVFGICFEGDFSVAVGAFEVEAEDLDAEVGFLVADFHAHVKLSADVEIVSAGVAPKRHRQHVSHHHELVLPSPPLHDYVVVEVLREILYEDLAFGHVILLCSYKSRDVWVDRRWGVGGGLGRECYKNITSMSSKGAITITHDELIKMKMRANVIPNLNSAENLAHHQYQQSQKRTDKWVDNPKDLKKRKEEERYRKFEKEELQRRKLDEEERIFQLKKKEEELAIANAKLFQDTEQVRALNSKLLYSDALQGREHQLQIKNYLVDIEKKRDQFYHEETMNQIRKGQEEERRKKEEEKLKLKQFEKNLRKQHKQVIKQYVNKYKEEMEEGELLKLKAEAHIREEEEKEREKRARNMQNRKDIDGINEKNKIIKASEAQKEREEQVKIEEYRKKQEIIQDLTKKRQQDLINEKIQQREQLYKQQSFKMSQIKNNEVERLNSQIDELEKKQAELERKKEQEKRILKAQYEESLKDQVQRRKREKEQEAEDNRRFKETWNDKLASLKTKESSEQRFRKNIYNKNAEELKRQMEEKQMKREQKLKQQLQADEQAKASLEVKDRQFQSYAEKCLKEWESNGKNLYPIIKHLSSTMKS